MNMFDIYTIYTILASDATALKTRHGYSGLSKSLDFDAVCVHHRLWVTRRFYTVVLFGVGPEL